MNKRPCWIVPALLGTMGILMALASVWCAETFSGPPHAVWGGIGVIVGVLLGCAAGMLLSRAAWNSDPHFRKLKIEEQDERNTMIRDKARARAGDVLEYSLFFGAIYLNFFDVPRWAAWILLGAAVVKIILNGVFSAWYRRKY